MTEAEGGRAGSGGVWQVLRPPRLLQLKRLAGLALEARGLTQLRIYGCHIEFSALQSGTAAQTSTLARRVFLFLLSPTLSDRLEIHVPGSGQISRD